MNKSFGGALIPRPLPCQGNADQLPLMRVGFVIYQCFNQRAGLPFVL